MARGLGTPALRGETRTIAGFATRCWQGGAGFPVLIIHGSGPGASAIGNWGGLLDALAERYRVMAFDLIGFGESTRKASPPHFDVALWCEQASRALALLDGETVGIMGHSVGGAIALKLAAQNRRIGKVLTTGCMGTDVRVNAHLKRLWRCPKSRDELRAVSMSLVYDRSLIDEPFLDRRMQVIGVPEHRRHFDSMFSGDLQQYVRAATLSEEELANISCDVLMVHGRDDEPFPPEETSWVLARRLPNADVVGLSRCGHCVALEQPEKLMAGARMLFG